MFSISAVYTEMYPNQRPGKFSWFMRSTHKLRAEQNPAYECIISIHALTTQLQYFWAHYIGRGKCYLLPRPSSKLILCTHSFAHRLYSLTQSHPLTHKHHACTPRWCAHRERGDNGCQVISGAFLDWQRGTSAWTDLSFPLGVVGCDEVSLT